MNIDFFQDYSKMSTRAASIVIEEVRKKPNLLLCAATGSSPAGVYKNLQNQAEEEEELFRNIQIVKLDEWIGLGKEECGTCEQYLKKNLIHPLGVSNDRYLSFNPETDNPAEDCKRVQSELQNLGSLDLCILGLGKNGHVGFNEPGSFVQANCHVAQLDLMSQQHAMIAGGSFKPKQGVTLGMGDILASKKIIMLVSGEGKEEAVQSLLSAKVTTQCPASFLWLHNNVNCLVVD